MIQGFAEAVFGGLDFFISFFRKCFGYKEEPVVLRLSMGDLAEVLALVHRLTEQIESAQKKNTLIQDYDWSPRGDIP